MRLTRIKKTRSGREYSSLCASLGATPVFCPDRLDILPLLTRAMERENESTQDRESDDEEPEDSSDDDELREGCGRLGISKPRTHGRQRLLP